MGFIQVTTVSVSLVNGDIDARPRSWYILYVGSGVHQGYWEHSEDFLTKNWIITFYTFEMLTVHCAAVATVSHDLNLVQLIVFSSISLLKLLLMHQVRSRYVRQYPRLNMSQYVVERSLCLLDLSQSISPVSGRFRELPSLTHEKNFKVQTAWISGAK